MTDKPEFKFFFWTLPDHQVMAYGDWMIRNARLILHLCLLALYGCASVVLILAAKTGDLLALLVGALLLWIAVAATFNILRRIKAIEEIERG